MGESKGVTRRRFVATAAGTAAGLAVIDTASGSSDAAGAVGAAAEAYPLPGAIYPDPKLPFGDPYKKIGGGTLKQIVSANRLVVETADGSEMPVEIVPGAYFFTDRDAQIGDFVIGENLAVEGQSNGKVFHATAVVSQLADIRTRILKRRGDVLETAAGTVRLTPRTIYRTWEGGPELSAATVRGGMSLVARVRVLPGRDPDVAIVKAVT